MLNKDTRLCKSSLTLNEFLQCTKICARAGLRPVRRCPWSAWGQRGVNAGSTRGQQTWRAAGSWAWRVQGIHAVVRPVQVQISEESVLHPDPGSRQCLEDDLLGAVNPVYQELQGEESVPNHQHVGVNTGTVDGEKARLTFWDLGRQEELKALWNKHHAKNLSISVCRRRETESKRVFEKMVRSEVLDNVPIPLLAKSRTLSLASRSHRDRVQRQHLQDPEARQPNPGLLRPPGQGAARVDGEARRGESVPASSRLRGVGASSRYRWCPLAHTARPIVQEELLLAPCLPCRGLGLLCLLVFPLALFFKKKKRKKKQKT